jgi:hypothetical protein
MATSKLMTSMKKHGLLTLLGILVLAIAMKQFTNRKGNSYEALSSVQPKWNDPRFNDGDDGAVSQNSAPTRAAPQAPQAANPVGQNAKFAAVNGMNASTQGLPPSCTRQPVANPAELLPLGNNAWGNLNPEGGGNMSGVNLLKAGYHAGVNTVGNTLRNANLQVRSEPPNPLKQVGPWNNTTIEPDLMRVPLEIGCGPQ